MRNLLWIVGRELRERKMIMLGALAIGVVLLVVPLLSRELPTRDAWDAAAIVSWLISYSIALLTGSSILAREIAERGATFHLARPLSEGVIWGGKMVAAWLLSLLCGALVLVPTTLLGSGLFALVAAPGFTTVVVAILVGTLMLSLLGHAAGIALRRRSSWLLFDLTAVTAFIILIHISAAPYRADGASELLELALQLLGGVVLVLFAIAGWYGFQRGRYEMGLVHRYQSAIGATALIALGLLALLVANEARDVERDDLLDVRPALCDSWECEPIVTGRAKGRLDYRATLAITDDGPRRLERPTAILMSLHRGRLVWGTAEGWDAETFDLMVQDRGEDRPRRTTLQFISGETSAMTLSADGSSLAVAKDDLLQIYDLDQGRLLQSVRLPFRPVRMRFLGETTLLANKWIRSQARSTRWEAVAVDLESKEVTMLGDFGLPIGFDRQSGTVVTAWAGLVRAFSTGDWQVLIEAPGDSAIITARGVLVEKSDELASNDRTELRLYSRDGKWEGVAIPKNVVDVELGPSDGDHVWLALSSKSGISADAYPDDTALYRLDLRSGEMIEVAEGLVPARVYESSVVGHYYYQFGPEGRRLVALDPDSGEIEILTGPQASRKESA